MALLDLFQQLDASSKELEDNKCSLTEEPNQRSDNSNREIFENLVGEYKNHFLEVGTEEEQGHNFIQRG